MQTIAIDDPDVCQSVCHAALRVYAVKRTAQRIDVVDLSEES